MRLERKLTTLAAAVVLCLSFANITRAQAPAAAQGKGGVATITPDRRVQQKTYRFESGDTATSKDMPYVLFVSSKVSRDKPAPLIVALHGLGGDGNFLVRERLVDLAEEQGYIMVGPMGYNERGWYGTPAGNAGAGKGKGQPNNDPPNLRDLSEKDVMNVLALMRKEFNVDPKRTYLLGHSMGGAGTLFLGTKYAKEWAALAAIAPAAFAMQNNAEAMLTPVKDTMPIIVIQGDADTAVPVASTRAWIDVMKKLKMDYKYKEEAGGDHGTVKNSGAPDIFDFFAKHSK